MSKAQNTEQKNIELIKAISCKDCAGTEELLKYGADPNYEYNLWNQAVIKPLALACSVGDLEIAELLLKNGATIENKYANMATNRSGSGYAGTLDLLLKNGAKLDLAPNKKGKTCLTKAIAQSDLEKVQILTEHGFDIHFVNQIGKTALHDAIESDNQDIAKYISDFILNKIRKSHSSSQEILSDLSVEHDFSQIMTKKEVSKIYSIYDSTKEENEAVKSIFKTIHEEVKKHIESDYAVISVVNNSIFPDLEIETELSNTENFLLKDWIDHILFDDLKSNADYYEGYLASDCFKGYPAVQALETEREHWQFDIWNQYFHSGDISVHANY